MSKHLLIKTVVCAILCLLLGPYVIPNIQGDGPDKRQSIDDHPISIQMSGENSIVEGYVTDHMAGYPLGNVNVTLEWQDSDGYQGSDSTQTDAIGFYLFHTTAVDVCLYFDCEDYFPEHSFWMNIGENGLLWFNISMVLIPEQNVFIQGYIIDNTSAAPIAGAEILLFWNDNDEHWLEKNTQSNLSGYYCFWTLPGRNQIVADLLHYYFSYGKEIFIENISILWLNISLIPYPPDTAVVYGYITDAELGDPISDVSVNVYCDAELGQFYNYTYSNENGFYSIGTIPGNLGVMAFKTHYLRSWSTNYDIIDNETLCVNLTMTFYPKENSRVKGYVVDNDTRAAVRNAFIRYDWKDEVGHFYSKSVLTDQKGYYSIIVPEGALQLTITRNGYTNQQTSWFFVGEDTDNWLNTTLTPEISVEFIKPHPGIYINNEARFLFLSRLWSRIFPNSIPLIIGPLDITVNITKSTLGCNRVEFYIDNKYLGTDTEEPFTYYWNEKGLSKHTIQVIAYDNAGPCTIETIMVRKLL
jgi:hypothetical protein